MNYKVSIIVPVYNVKKYLVTCLDSLINQTYENLEVLLIDDGSTDGSELICDEFAAKDKRIKVIHQKNVGVSAARNVGLDIASGEFIYFLDSDDYIETEMSQQMVNIADGVDVIICNFYIDYVNRHELFYKGNLYKTFSNDEAIKVMLSGGDNPIFLGHLGHKFFRREILKGVTFDSKFALYEDLLFVVKAFINASNIRYTSYAGYHYIQRFNSIMYSKFSLKTYSSIGACFDIYSLVKIKFPLLSSEAQLLYLKANLKQASLCVYSKASPEYLEHIRMNILKEKPVFHDINRLSAKERIYYKLLCFNMSAFTLLYKIIIKPNRRRYDKILKHELYSG